MCLLVLALGGCNIESRNNTVTSNNNTSDTDTYEFEASQLEEKYLKTNNADDLKKLCSTLDLMRVDKSEYYQMVIQYYPSLFSEFSVNEMMDVSKYGFDEYYAKYVVSLLAEDRKDDFQTAYYLYKRKADNVYHYLSYVCIYALQLDHLTEAELELLYTEADSLNDQAKSANIDFNTRLDAFLSIRVICEAMGKESELAEIDEQLKEFWQNNSDIDIPED